jgi:tetratricopeptide (TPR) repeat protein
LALTYFQESLALNQELGDKQSTAWAHFGLSQVAFQQCNHEQAESLAQRTLALLSEVGDNGGIAWVIRFMGQVNFAQGNYRGATLLFEMALEMARQQNHIVTAAFCFPGFVCIAAHDDQPQLAARLLGMAEALRAQVVTTGSAPDVADYDQLLGEARNTINTSTFAQQIAEGRNLSPAQALDFALRTFAEHE